MFEGELVDCAWVWWLWSELSKCCSRNAFLTRAPWHEVSLVMDMTMDVNALIVAVMTVVVLAGEHVDGPVVMAARRPGDTGWQKHGHVVVVGPAAKGTSMLRRGAGLGASSKKDESFFGSLR